MQDIEKTTYELSHHSRNGYNFTVVRVSTMRLEDVVQLRDGAVGNKAGYRTADAARRQLGRYQGLLDRDVTQIYDGVCFGTRLNITIEWQHYEQPGESLDYCEANLHLGTHFAEITHGLDFLRKLGQRIERARSRREHPAYHHPVSGRTFSSPDEVVAALARMRTSVQVERDNLGEVWVATPAKIYKVDAA